MDRPITVLLVDDHEVVRRGLRASLEAHPDFDVVGEADSAGAAVARLTNNPARRRGLCRKPSTPRHRSGSSNTSSARSPGGITTSASLPKPVVTP